MRKALRFENPARMPRDLWVLPWAAARYPAELAELQRRFPSDLCRAPDVYAPSSRRRGDMFACGEYTDEWGCVFENLQEGVIGEVKRPLLADWADRAAFRPPVETLPQNVAAARRTVNAFCAQTDRFVTGACCPRPWERYQFLRGSENSMVDSMVPGEGLSTLLREIHAFYLRELEFWVTTDVDAITFMDDWGSQRQLLIPPVVWRDLFKPIYKDYCDLAHAHGKFAFMHSDGHIAEVYEDLVEIGVDALNSQLFVMDIAELGRRYKGRITFWGEMDRQHVLAATEPQIGRDAVRQVARHLFDERGGVIAQLELGPGGNSAVALAVFEEWAQVEREARTAAP
jgi:hypothetical protein